MTLQPGRYEVGVRDLHDRLSEHLGNVENGSEVVVTRHGKPVARLSAVDREDPLRSLVERGLARAPTRKREPARPRVSSSKPVSDLVAEQRR